MELTNPPKNQEFPQKGKPEPQSGIISGPAPEGGKLHLMDESPVVLAEILDNSINEIYIFDSETFSFLWANKGAAGNIGFPKDELLKLTPIDIKPEFTFNQFAEFVKPLKDGQIPVLVFETVHRRKNGSLYNVEVHLQKTFYEGHEAFVAFILDITKRKKTEAVVIESEKKYHSLFSNMINGFAYHKILLDPDGNPSDYQFLEANESFEKLTGLKAKNIIGKKVTEVLPGIENDPAGWIQEYGKVALENKSIKFEQFAEPLQKWYSVSVYCPQKGYFATIFEDITERKLAEKEINKYKEHLEELIKQRTAELEAKNQQLDDSLKVFVGREIQIRNLKSRIEQLEGKRTK